MPEYMISTGGSVEEVDPAEVTIKLARGWRPASPQQIADAQAAAAYQAQYGGWKGKMMAADYAAMRALTLGGSDVLGKAMRGDEYTQEAQGFREVNPGADVAGTVAGLGLGLAAGPVTGIGAATRAGTATTKAAGSLLGVGGPKAATMAGGEVLKRALAEGAGSAITGAAFGAGALVSEHALGDLDLTAETVMGRVGVSALAGFGIGAVGSGVWNLGHNVKSYIKPRVHEWAAKEAEVLKLRGLGGPGAKGRRLIHDWNERGADIGFVARKAEEWGVGGVTQSAATAAKKVESKLSEIGAQMGTFTQEADDLLKPDNLTKASSLIGRAKARISNRLFKNPDPAHQAAAAKFNEYLDNIGSTQGDVLGVKQLHDLRVMADQSARWGRAYFPGVDDYPGAMRAMRRMLSGEIDKALGTLPQGSSRLATWRALNDDFAAAKRLADLTEVGVEAAEMTGLSFTSKMAGVASGAALGAAGLGAEGVGMAGLPGALLGAAATAGGMEALRRVGPKVGAAALEGLAGLTEAAPTIAGIGSGATGTALAGVGASLVGKTLQGAAQEGALADLVNETGRRLEGEGRVQNLQPTLPGLVGQTAFQVQSRPEAVAVLAELERGQKELLDRLDRSARAVVRENEPGHTTSHSIHDDPAVTQRKFAKRVEAIQRVMEDPNVMPDVLVKMVEDWDDSAPSVAQALQIGTLRAVSYLGQTMPRSESPGPFSPPIPPHREKVASWMRVWDAVEDPLSVLKQARSHTLTPEAAAAVQTVYPKLWEQFQTATLRAVADYGPDKVPYQRRLMLSMILGGDLDGSMNASTIVYNQQTYGGLSQRQQMPGSQQPNRSKVTLGQRSQTNTGAAAGREQEQQ